MSTFIGRVVSGLLGLTFSVIPAVERAARLHSLAQRPARSSRLCRPARRSRGQEKEPPPAGRGSFMPQHSPSCRVCPYRGAALAARVNLAGDSSPTVYKRFTQTSRARSAISRPVGALRPRRRRMCRYRGTPRPLLPLRAEAQAACRIAPAVRLGDPGLLGKCSGGPSKQPASGANLRAC